MRHLVRGGEKGLLVRRGEEGLLVRGQQEIPQSAVIHQVRSVDDVEENSLSPYEMELVQTRAMQPRKCWPNRSAKRS